MTRQITGALFKAMVLNGAAAIENHKGEINELNVFPVPDGDTGTNMSLTMGAAAAALGGASPGTVGKAAEIAAGALLRGARGNSGVILSLLFRGVSRCLKDQEAADAVEFARAMSAGVESAYKAVMKPAEGTMLTVSRVVAATAALEAEKSGDIEAVLERALKAGYEALANTTNQNPVLKKAGVVDAGGKGYLYILEGMLKALRGERLQADAPPPEAKGKADFAAFGAEDITFTYCTEFIVKRNCPKNAAVLRDFLEKKGDSVVVVEDDELIKVHVHSDEPGVIITEALTYGPLVAVKIENMREQHTEMVIGGQTQGAPPGKTAGAGGSAGEPYGDYGAGADADAGTFEGVSDGDPEPLKEIGVVAVCAGEGMCQVFRDLGADGIVLGGQTMNPSTEDILKKIEETPAETVFILPNNKNIIMAAQQCVPLAEKRVVVIPTRSMPQGVSAMIALDPAKSVEENAEAMAKAAEKVRTAQITYAARDSVFDGHEIREGDYIALLEDALVATGRDVVGLAEAIAARLAGLSPEFVTVFPGENVDEQTTDEIVKRLSEAVPSAETSVVYGGQPVYYYIISAE